jgi:hypothetical protein
VLVDEGFKVPSTEARGEARGAVVMAAKFVPWCKVEANKASFGSLSGSRVLCKLVSSNLDLCEFGKKRCGKNFMN